jgi:hypothetical protein
MNVISIKEIYTESHNSFIIEYHFKKLKVFLKNDTFVLSLVLGSIKRNIIEKSFYSVLKYFTLDSATLREIIKNKTLSNFKNNY